MAEPLGILASLIAVVQISSKVISICYAYRSGVKKAPRDLTRITSDVTSLRDIIEQLIRIVDEDSSSKNSRLHTIQTLNEPGGPLIRLQYELKTLEAKLKPASGWNAVGQALMWPLREGDVNNTLSFIERVKSTLSLSLLTDHTARTLAIEDATQNIQSGIEALTQKVSQEGQDDRLSNIIDWLDAPAHSFPFHTALGKRHAISGQWFLDERDFKEWKTTPNSLLWLHGIPSTIIDTLNQDCRSEESSAVAYYFFEFSDERKHVIEGVLCSMISQLLMSSSKPPPKLIDLLDEAKMGSRSAWHLSVRSLSELLAQASETFDHVYFILDALDECVRREEMWRFLDSFIDLTVNSSSGNPHLLVTSRTEKEIEEHLTSRSTAQVLLWGDRFSADIRSFILSKLQTDRKLKSLPQQLKDEIETTLMNGAGGMFRWVACQVDALSRCSRLSTIRTALRSLPKDLDETYFRILKGVEEENCQDVIKILKWLSFSIRPVRLDEVAEALSIDWKAQDNPSFDQELRLLDIQDVLTMCSSLVTTSNMIVKSGDGSLNRNVELRLAHFSVKEYLISERIRHSSMSMYALVDHSAHTFIAQCCLAYLLQFKASLDEESLWQYPLANYAAQYWTDHVLLSSNDESYPVSEQLALRLLQSNSIPYANCCRIYNADQPWKASGWAASVTNTPPPLYYTSRAGLEVLVRSLLIGGADPNASGGLYGNALQVAALEGHEHIVKLLLSNKVDVNEEDGLHGSALVAAASKGHESIARLLLERGADVNASPCLRGNTALQEAVRRGDIRMSRLLLDHGADVNQAHGKSKCGLPLKTAVARNDRDIIALLVPHASRRSLDQGIEVTASRGDWDMCQLLLSYGANLSLALYHAAMKGFKEIVKQLIDKGADVNFKEVGWNPINPLIAAAGAGHTSVVQQLLESGADGSMAGYYTNALQAAAAGGYDTIVRLLLAKNVDVNMDGKLGTALHRAARFGHLSSVKLLLDNGAKVGSGEALCYGARSGHTTVVQELLDRGVDVDSYGDGQYPSAIQGAAQAGNLPLVQYLVHRGATVNTANGRRSALQESAGLGNTALVQLLLDAGADIESRDGDDPSALHYATRTGRFENVKILLKRGADVNRHNRIIGGTESALHAAAREGEVAIARVLLEAGADVNDQVADEVGFTALHLAARAGHDSFLPVLIDDFGADLGVRLTNGSLALNSAALGGSRSCAEFLLGKGMDVNSRNYDGRTALHFAVEAKHKDIIAFLLEKGIDVEVADGKTGMTALDLVELNIRNDPWHPLGGREMWEELAEMLRKS